MNYRLQMFTIRLISLILVVAFISSCKKEQVQPVDSNTQKLANCLLILNEGLFQQNNASVSKIDLSSGLINSSFFEDKTGRPLGDTGNDIKMYQGKIFIVTNVSSTLEILDATTGASIKQISMVSNGIPKQPRYITFQGNKGYISCFDGYVDVLDLSSLTISKRIKVGENPEQLAVSNNKLYVANSGGLNFPNLDSTVSVISLNAELEICKITVGKNPGSLLVDGQGDVYVVSRGDFGSNPSRLHRISSISDTKEQTFSFEADRICLMNDQLLVSYLSVGITKILKLNVLNESVVSTDCLDLTQVQTFYGFQFEPLQNKLYCFDAQGYVNTGKIHEFDSNGNYLTNHTVGLIPNQLLYYE
ncbi:MAG: DUF5074 domain-containing protein [Crocinitomicaceae bacterium]